MEMGTKEEGDGVMAVVMIPAYQPDDRLVEITDQLWVKVLDWYNPYMDFSGHISGIQFLLYACIFLQLLCNESAYQASDHRRKIRKKRG